MMSSSVGCFPTPSREVLIESGRRTLGNLKNEKEIRGSYPYEYPCGKKPCDDGGKCPDDKSSSEEGNNPIKYPWWPYTPLPEPPYPIITYHYSTGDNTCKAKEK